MRLEEQPKSALEARRKHESLTTGAVLKSVFSALKCQQTLFQAFSSAVSKSPPPRSLRKWVKRYSHLLQAYETWSKCVLWLTQTEVHQRRAAVHQPAAHSDRHPAIRRAAMACTRSAIGSEGNSRFCDQHRPQRYRRWAEAQADELSDL